jgi:hypothetical protein
MSSPNGWDPIYRQQSLPDVALAAGNGCFINLRLAPFPGDRDEITDSNLVFAAMH